MLMTSAPAPAMPATPSPNQARAAFNGCAFPSVHIARRAISATPTARSAKPIAVFTTDVSRVQSKPKASATHDQPVRPTAAKCNG